MSVSDAYLSQIGRLTYEMAKLEGLALFDLPRLSPHLSSSLDVVELEGEPMGGVGAQVLAAGKSALEPKVGAYLVACGNAINSVVRDRNHLAHSRPAQNPDSGSDELLRRRRDGSTFFLDATWCRTRLAEIQQYQSTRRDQTTFAVTTRFRVGRRASLTTRVGAGLLLAFRFSIDIDIDLDLDGRAVTDFAHDVAY